MSASYHVAWHTGERKGQKWLEATRERVGAEVIDEILAELDNFRKILVAAEPEAEIRRSLFPEGNQNRGGHATGGFGMVPPAARFIS